MRGICMCCACGPSGCNVGRNQFVEMLRERGVGTSVHCIPLHTMDFIRSTYGYRTGEFPGDRRHLQPLSFAADLRGDERRMT